MARGLSTIAARIVKNQDALAKYNIVVQNADGSLKSTYDVLTELAPQWEKMTDAQRVALGDSIAGWLIWPETDLIDGEEGGQTPYLCICMDA